MARPRRERELHKNKKIDFRLTESQYEIIEANSKRAGMTISEYVRRQSVYGTVKVSYPIVAELPALQKLTNEFAAVGNNLNQIARYFNMGGLQSKAMREDINSCIEEIMKLRKEVLEMAGDFHGCTEASIQQKL